MRPIGVLRDQRDGTRVDQTGLHYHVGAEPLPFTHTLQQGEPAQPKRRQEKARMIISLVPHSVGDVEQQAWPKR